MSYPSLIDSDNTVPLPLTYTWSVTKGGVAYTPTNPSFIGATDQPTFTFTPDDNATYVTTVTVRDSGGLSTAPTGSGNIVVTNVVPVVTGITNVPADHAVTEGTVTPTMGVTFTDVSPIDAAGTYTCTWAVTKDGVAYTPTGYSTTNTTFFFAPTDNGSLSGESDRQG